MQVTDRGLEHLVGDVANPGCVKLVEINLTSTSITDKGVELLLRSESNLHSLSVVGASTSKGSNFTFSAPEGCQLNCLDVSYTDITDSAVRNICSTCPFITDLSLGCCSSLSAASLQHISSLKHLRKLNIAAMRIGFLADFVPFLKASGNSLEVVDVTGMESVDTQFFGLYCCSLRELRLIDCRDVLGSFVNRPGYNQSLSLAEACPNLELLNLQGCQFSPGKSCQDHISAVISNSINLRVLNLSNIEGLNDDSIVHFALSSELTRFYSLNLSQCVSVTIDALIIFLDRCKGLALLDVSHCHSISLQDVEGLRKMAKDAGSKMEIRWV